MANNQYINKVQFGDTTVMDITDTTADAADVIEGEVFYAKNGARSVGTLGAMTGATASTNGAAGLVPAPSSGDNEKFLRGDGTWAAFPDTSIFATKANPTFTGAISLLRAANSTVGEHSIAVGDTVIATGEASIATGGNTEAHGLVSYAGGYLSIAGGQCSHAEGVGILAPFSNQFAIGMFNSYGNISNWVAGTSYVEGDEVLYNNAYYWCIEDNTDSEWDATKWQHKPNDMFTIGYGQDGSSRANLLNVDTSGDLYLKGNVYVGANDSSTSGSKVATETYVSTAIGNIATMTGATSSANGAAGLIPAPTSADYQKFFRGDGTWQDGGRPMVILSYGNSTWNDFITAYNNNVIVYCRASSNSNPASGSQTRMAFMAYVNNATTPTEVEFQYYRSMSSHSTTAMGDQVFVYKITNKGVWSVTTRDASIKEINVASGSKLGVSWSSNKVTLSNTMTAADMPMSSSDATTAKAAIDALNSNIAPLVKQAWTWGEGIKPTLTNGSHYSYGTYYFKIGCFIYLSISAEFSSAPTNSLLFTLPEGCRPIGSVEISVAGGASYNAKAQCTVGVTGGVYVTSVDKYVIGSGLFVIGG